MALARGYLIWKPRIETPELRNRHERYEDLCTTGGGEGEVYGSSSFVNTNHLYGGICLANFPRDLRLREWLPQAVEGKKKRRQKSGLGSKEFSTILLESMMRVCTDAEPKGSLYSPPLPPLLLFSFLAAEQPSPQVTSVLNDRTAPQFIAM